MLWHFPSSEIKWTHTLSTGECSIEFCADQYHSAASSFNQQCESWGRHIDTNWDISWWKLIFATTRTLPFLKVRGKTQGWINCAFPCQWRQISKDNGRRFDECQSGRCDLWAFSNLTVYAKWALIYCAWVVIKHAQIISSANWKHLLYLRK